jgi:hypothetical protein
MDPVKFGPCLWRSIHIIALGYPENPSEIDKQTYTNYYRDLWKIIPCLKCSLNYRRHWTELPIYSFLDSREHLFEWTVLLHNIVNKELGKKQISLEEAYKIYNNDRIDVPTQQKASAIYISIIVVLILIIIALYVKFNR